MLLWKGSDTGGLRGGAFTYEGSKKLLPDILAGGYAAIQGCIQLFSKAEPYISYQDCIRAYFAIGNEINKGQLFGGSTIILWSICQLTLRGHLEVYCTCMIVSEEGFEPRYNYTMVCLRVHTKRAFASLL